ncbi:MAG: FkbM family methyltransferase [Candidatus Kerfeldbacteria bacterium]
MKRSLLPPMISYAEHGEDVILRRAFPGPTGFYVDVGAGFPTVTSVTKHFYDKGWFGINIEPYEAMFETLERARLRDVNLDCAVGSKAGKAVMSFFSDSFGLSTLDPSVTKRHRAAGLRVGRTTVDVRTLNDILEKHAPDQPIDFIKIDVEGREKDVLRSFDLKRWSPRVLIIESTVPTSPKPSFKAWEEIVTGAGYTCSLFDGLNRYYAKAGNTKLLHALSLSPNPFDSFVPFGWWGMIPQFRRKQYIKRKKMGGKDMRAFERFEAQWPQIRKEFELAWGYSV